MYDESQYKIKASEVLEKTNGGLDVILSYYPAAADVADKKKTHFKIRNEKSASARLTQAKETGVWIVTDFGSDSVPRNAIEIVRLEENMTFGEALRYIVDKWNIQIEGVENRPIAQADITKRPATKDEVEGKVYFFIRYDDKDQPTFTTFELTTLGPFVNKNDCIDNNLYALRKYIRIKNREAIEVNATDAFPIFMIDEGDFQKIYQPMSQDKGFRFSYAGTRPKSYVFGLDNCRKAYNRLVSRWKESADDEEKNQPKLKRIILCMGDRDSINVYSLDKENYVIWLNSESEMLSGTVYKELNEMSEQVYQIPDMDSTGRKHGVKLALKFITMKTIWLPEELTQMRDWRGNPCKDITDFIKKWDPNRVKKEFNSLMHVAPTAQFWDEKPEFDKSDKFIGLRYTFNNVHAYYFLNLLGIFRFRNPNEKTGYIYIKIDGNIVKEIEPVDIKNYVNEFLEKRRYPSQLRNMIYKTTQLNENSLSNIWLRDIDFTDFDRDYQFLFFRNATWKVSKDKIEEFKPENVDRYVWEDEVIDKRVKLMDNFFTVTTIDHGDGYKEYDIEIENTECLFFRYLIQTSRIHWRKELEDSFQNKSEEISEKYFKENQFKIDGSNLDDDEIQEQKLHLINKIYALGYLMHRYKDPSKPWAVFAMDNKISEEGESHGGAGKSICFKAPKFFMKSIEFNGRNKKLTENPHIYENVTVHTDYILVDDADQYLNFEFFFKPLTGDLDVNPKGTRQYSIPFSDSPKFCITSNYTLRNIDPSTERRLLYVVFSDYYHYNSNSEYRQHRNPYDDFGKNLFDDFTDKEWELFLNFMAQCIKFYLNHSKIGPPMKNVELRNLKTIITDAFLNWAEIYFHENRLNINVKREDAFHDFQEKTNSKQWKVNRFTKSLKAWCRYQGYQYNPETHCNAGNGDKKDRIIEKIDNKPVEMFYIKTQPVLENATNSIFNHPVSPNDEF